MPWVAGHGVDRARGWGRAGERARGPNSGGSVQGKRVRMRGANSLLLGAASWEQKKGHERPSPPSEAACPLGAPFVPYGLLQN